MLGIVIPAYNRRDCLREALMSLTIQTDGRFFVIIVDDHSDIPLKDIVDEFRDKLHIIYKYQQENRGPGAARQAGLEVCYEKNFDLVMFMDSDDMLYPHAVSRLTTEIRRSMCDVVSSIIWGEDSHKTGFVLPADNKTWLHGKIFRTQYLKENNICFPTIRTNEDLAFNLMAIEGTKKAALIEEPLYLFRNDKQSITRGERPTSLFSNDYISAIYVVFNYLASKENITEQIVIDIIGCFNYYQTGILFNQDMSLEKQKLVEMINHPQVKKFLNSSFEMQKIIKVINHYTIISKKIYYFKQTFKDWLEEMTNENSCN